MRILEVIEAKRWVNTVTGQTASIYGSVPYFGAADKPHWTIVSVGYTWRLSNGTVGLGRQPVKTRVEAEQVMQSFNETTPKNETNIFRK